MPAVVKFGGSSFLTGEHYGRIAEHLMGRRKAEQAPVVTVVSGRSGATERLRAVLLEVTSSPSSRSVAELLTLADTESAQLLRAAVEAAGGSAAVLTGPHCGIVTDRNWMWARIERLDPAPLQSAIAERDVVILPGGQAGDGQGNLTWMGKNSSDLSAVAAAVILGLPTCEIYSDVDGIYTADPSLVPEAHVIKQVGYAMASALASRGAKVLHRRSLALAQQESMRVVCRLNTQHYGHGTEVGPSSSEAVAVVIDLKSVLLTFRSDTEADATYSALHASGIEVVRLEDLPSAAIAVTGGYVDVDRFLSSRQLPGTVVGGRLVSVIEGAHARSFTAPDEVTAVELGRQLHQRYVA